MEWLFHVKRMFVALAPVPGMASRPQTSLDSMNRRCLSMRFYDAKWASMSYEGASMS